MHPNHALTKLFLFIRTLYKQLQPRRTHSNHIHSPCTLSLNPCPHLQVTHSSTNTRRLWSTKTVECECVGILKGHDDYVNCVLCTAGYIITASADKTIRKWEAASCDCVHVFRGHASIINRIISTGDYVFSSSYDKSVRLVSRHSHTHGPRHAHTFPSTYPLRHPSSYR